VRREVFRELADTMHRAPSVLAAEENLIHAKREHRDCPLEDPCKCGLLAASGAFYVTVSEQARSLKRYEVYEKLLTQWVDVAVAHAAGVDIAELALRMHATAFTYRLLTN
jgi:hypothetical protein